MKVAFIGSVGVPNVYGGFEMFLEVCGPVFAKYFDLVLITCDKFRYDDRSKIWRGVRRVFVPVRANGFLSLVHDLIAFFVVFWRVDVIVVLGVSSGIFFPIFRIICSLTGKILIVNVDGIESRRLKFSRGKQLFLCLSERLAQWFAHCVVIDNEALREFLAPNIQAKAVLIAYPGDHVLRSARLPISFEYQTRFLTVCRIEPENQCHVLLEAFAQCRFGTYVFVGNWNASEYGRTLRKKYGHVIGLEMRDPIYEVTTLASLRENCDFYLHGHSVGGTNPSLVEMLFYDCTILAFDCPFNRCTAGNHILYFKDLDDLVAQILLPKPMLLTERGALRKQYTKEKISQKYINLIEELKV